MRNREQELPKGAFGEEYPQNIQTSPTSQSVSAKRVRASPAHQDSDRIDHDGLPHIGAAIWPGQGYYATLDRITSKCPAEHVQQYLGLALREISSGNLGTLSSFYCHAREMEQCIC